MENPDHADKFAVPPKQRPYEVAFDGLNEKLPDASALVSLGAARADGIIRLPALRQELLIDPAARTVEVAGLGPARHTWTLLALHYLSAGHVAIDTREVTLTHFPDARGYLTVFNNRIVGRFLATSGKTDEGFRQRAEAAGGDPVPWSGTSYRFFVFPRLPITVIRYEGDEENPPGANIVYCADAEYLLPAEDRVVAIEVLLEALSGVPMHVVS